MYVCMYVVHSWFGLQIGSVLGSVLSLGLQGWEKEGHVQGLGIVQSGGGVRE